MSRKKPFSFCQGFENPDLAAVVVPCITDWAWAIGIYEGEGWTFNGADGKSVVVRVGQNHPWILDKLKALFGGSVKPDRRSGDFKVWVICGSRARRFLLTAYPHLSPKRQGEVRNIIRGRWKGLIEVEA